MEDNKAHRNFYVHAYGNIDIEAVWITLTKIFQL